MSRFVPNPNFQRQFQQEPQARQMFYDAGRQVRRYAVSMAPRHTGYYRWSLKVLPDGTVYTDDPFGHLVEYGSTNNPAYAPIRRGVKAAGLEFRPLPKH